MDICHIWCNLEPGVADLPFVQRTGAYLERLREQGTLAGYRITRAKLGLRPPGLADFHLMLDFENLAQLDAAFSLAAARTDPVEQLHHAVNSLVKDVTFALYRDFPDPVRVSGQERF
jgi:hypothetical protein